MIMATWSLGRISGWRPIASIAPLPRKPMPMPDPMAARPMPSGSPSPSAAGKSMDSPPPYVISVCGVRFLVRVLLVRQHHVEVHGREERKNQRLHDARQGLEHHEERGDACHGRYREQRQGRLEKKRRGADEHH